MRMIEEFFENSADSVIGINQYQRICFWNRACERLFGLPPGQVRDKSCNDVVRGSDLNGDVFAGLTVRFSANFGDGNRPRIMTWSYRVRQSLLL